MMDSVTMDKPKPSKRRGRWTGPTAYNLISDHLEEHGSITPDEANDLYGISKGGFVSTICYLRRDGWNIKTSRYENDAGQLRSRYHKPAGTPPSKQSHTVAVRIGDEGLEVQLASDNDIDTTPFFRLTPKQVEYLALNFKMYQALTDAKKDTE